MYSANPRRAGRGRWAGGWTREWGHNSNCRHARRSYSRGYGSLPRYRGVSNDRCRVSDRAESTTMTSRPSTYRTYRYDDRWSKGWDTAMCVPGQSWVEGPTHLPP